MHSRAWCYQWEWERFANHYMVFDALYRVAVELHAVKDKEPHAERLAIMMNEYGVFDHPILRERIYRLRNQLFHEALWDGRTPTSASSHNGLYSSYHLGKIVQRLVPAMLGFKTPYSASAWWQLGTFSFVD